MKHILFVVLETGHETEELLLALSRHGVNGTVIPSTSLKHVLLHSKETPAFVTLRHLLSGDFEDNTTLFMIVEESMIPELKDEIRKYSNNFKDIHGAMFSMKLGDFEGSF